MGVIRKESNYFTVDDGSEDGIDMEETRYPYYNDNLDLVGYTSELREKETGKFFAFVDFSADADDDIGLIRFCPHCEQYGFKHKLGPKIQKKGEPIAPDDEQFLSCYECGNTFPLHETHFESKIKDSVETTDNPFNNESVFLSGETRKEQWRKKGTDRRKNGKYQNEDPDIQAEIDRHDSNNVRVIT